MNTIYQNIRRLSEQKKVQQKDIAEALNVGTNTVNNWFKGKTSMKAEQIPPIANLLGVSVEEIYLDTYSNKLELPQSYDVKSKYYNCPECIEKQKKIEKLEQERDKYHDKYIDCLEDFRQLMSDRKRASG